jgi:hypothetical protein
MSLSILLLVGGFAGTYHQAPTLKSWKTHTFFFSAGNGTQSLGHARASTLPLGYTPIQDSYFLIYKATELRQFPAGTRTVI